jgi:pantothenate kinase-related protein Tda10
VVVSALLPGPLVLVVVPNTELAITWGITVPSPHDETVRVKEVPEEALIENTQPVAVPAFEKSLFATELTF